MNRSIRWLILLCLPLAASCFQKGPGREGVPPQFPDAGNINVQCPNGSAQCFTLCGSPECALPDASLPPVLDEAVIWYQPGGSVNNVGTPAPAKSTTDPCVAINDASKTIRQRSCAPCHNPSGPEASIFDYVLDDMKLATSMNHAGTTPMITPGHPDTTSSFVYKRMVDGLIPGGGGMPPSTISGLPDPTIVVYPTPADVSVIYAWILNCMPNANQSAYQTSYAAGPGYGPAAKGHTDGGAAGN